MKASQLHPGSGPVRLINPEGKYLAKGKKGFLFTGNPDRALVFEYDEGGAQRVLGLFAEKGGLQLSIEYVGEVGEDGERTGETISPVAFRGEGQG